MYNFTVMYENTAVAIVKISNNHKQVKIQKLVPDSIIQPFSGSDCSIYRVYNFLKSRCYEDARVDLKEILSQTHLTNNNPWEWNKITHGVMWEDNFWIMFENENLKWEDVRWRT